MSAPYAPYPPEMGGHQPSKSALSSSPYYSQRTNDSSQNGIEKDNTDSDLKIERSAATQHASQIQIFPCAKDIIACINCVQPTLQQGIGLNSSQPREGTSRSRKNGPLMLELRKTEFVEESFTTDGFFTTRSIGFSRGNPSLGISVASTCLDLPPVKKFPNKSRFVAATGSTHGMLCIHTFGEASDDADGLLSSNIEYFHTPRRQATATSVAWRSTHLNHVAVGLLGSSASSQPQAPPRRGGGSIRASGGGDREFCCLIWDIEKQSTAKQRNSSPLFKLSHNSPVASLAWMMDGSTLAVGSQSSRGLVGIYDMRVSGTNVAPISALAHQNGVHGIEVDQFRQNYMATFSRSAGEAVKLWDIRRMDSVLGEIKVGSGGVKPIQSSSSHGLSHGVVEAIKWDALEPGTLSVAIDSSIHDYDTKSGSRPVLVRVNHAKGGTRIRDFALYPGEDEKVIEASQSQTSPILDQLYSRRLMAILDDRKIYDMAKHNFAPVAISFRDGRLAHSLGGNLFVGDTTGGPIAMERSSIVCGEDVSATMMRRARCLRATCYSMDTSSNITVLSEDISSSMNSADVHSPTLTLLRLWTWIDRVESLCENVEGIEDDFVWPAKGLLDAGVWHLLQFDSEPLKDDVHYLKTLSCNIYDSPSRRCALSSCGWASKYELVNVLAECEANGEYERSAALAVFHGDIAAAVKVLQRASQTARVHPQGTASTIKYAETLDLVAMCIAGFGSNTGSPSDVWQIACSSLLQRDDLVATPAKNSGVAYLRALCQFLLKVGTPESLDYILGNDELSLSDRVAFACRFLRQEDLNTFLSKCISSCQSSGNIEGLVISGLSKPGIKILQAFVDLSSDIQTASLVVSRIVVPQDWQYERKSCIEWVENYRNFLNSLQMWQSRAIFDVDRAEVLRRIKSRNTEGASSAGQKTVSYQSRRLQNPNRRQGPRSADPDFLSSIPAQLDARCNYCSSPLGLKQGVASQWLSKMRPVLSCCPQCRKPLPRCAICLLPLGCLNPYMELTRDRSRPGPRGSPSLPSPDDLSSLANLPFAEWFTWCMRCKHGGHAHHLISYFTNHDTCPVSGCDCRCQFDGIQKLNRPALSQHK